MMYHMTLNTIFSVATSMNVLGVFGELFLIKLKIVNFLAQGPLVMILTACHNNTHVAWCDG